MTDLPEWFEILKSTFIVVTPIFLFLYGLENFTNIARDHASRSIRTHLSQWTEYRWVGFLLGALTTGFIQSSSAVSSLVVSLVESSVLPFWNALPVLFGTNVGTVVTTQFVAFKLTFLGPFLITVGFVVSVFPKLKVLGKSVFYFGFVLFSLDLISDHLKPFGEKEAIRNFLSLPFGPFFGIAIGALCTVLFQSSSVTMGLLILLIQQGVMIPDNAYAIVLGANIGTTSTSLLVSTRMGKMARVTAFANFVFNSGGVLLFLPVLSYISKQDSTWVSDPAQQVAFFHLIFNLATAVFFLLFLTPFYLGLKKIFKLQDLDLSKDLNR